MYCKDSDVIFVVPEDMLGDTAVSAVLTTLYREVLYEIDQYVGSPKLCDKNVDQVLQLFKQVSAGLSAAPVSALNEETREKYAAFVEFLHKLHGFTTKVNEVDQCINLGSQTLNKFKKTDGNALPAPAAEPPVQAEPADGEPDDSDGDSETGNDAMPHGEEPPEDDGEEPEEQEQQPVLDGNLTFMPENNSVVPQNIGSPTQLANIIQQLH